MAYKDSDIQKAWRDQRYRDLRALVEEARDSGECADCGEEDSVVLQFHHRVASEKKFNIGGAPGHMSLKTMTEEIEKCDLVCANCHLRRHAEQVQAAKAA